MSHYRVYTKYCETIDIEAELVRHMSLYEADSNKVVFVTGGDVIAEFYIANICGFEVIKKPISEKVIRCKDCKFYTSLIPTEGVGICSLAGRHLGDDGFCSEAERREE